jgi:hypothetical protein
MSVTLDTTTVDAQGRRATAEAEALAHEVPGTRRRPLWALFGAGAGASALAATFVGMPSDISEEDWSSGVAVIDQLERGGYHVAFVLGMISIGLLLVAAAGWKRWAERSAPDDLAARTIGTALGATAAINIVGYSMAGSMALYLPGGVDEGWLSREALFANFTYLDFGLLFGWWGAFVAAICVAVLSFRRAANRVFPRWMGVVSVILCLPAFLMGVAMPLPGMVGFTMPIWLVMISLGLFFSRKARV